MKKIPWQNPPTPVSPNRSYRYRQCLTGPVSLYFSKADNRLFLRVTPIGNDPRDLDELDILTAELTALAIARSHWRLRFTSARLDVYLAFPNLTQVAIDFDEDAVRERVDSYLSQHYRRMPDSMPVQVLAYSMLQREALTRPRQAKAEADNNHARTNSALLAKID
ncbi:MAG: hypothetical protein AAFQ16_09195 [Pseudomonadota bacterium]